MNESGEGEGVDNGGTSDTKGISLLFAYVFLFSLKVEIINICFLKRFVFSTAKRNEG